MWDEEIPALAPNEYMYDGFSTANMYVLQKQSNINIDAFVKLFLVIYNSKSLV